MMLKLKKVTQFGYTKQDTSVIDVCINTNNISTIEKTHTEYRNSEYNTSTDRVIYPEGYHATIKINGAIIQIDQSYDVFVDWYIKQLSNPPRNIKIDSGGN